MSEKLSMHRIMAVLLLVALCALTGCALQQQGATH